VTDRRTDRLVANAEINYVVKPTSSRAVADRETALQGGSVSAKRRYSADYLQPQSTVM